MDVMTKSNLESVAIDVKYGYQWQISSAKDHLTRFQHVSTCQQGHEKPGNVSGLLFNTKIPKTMTANDCKRPKHTKAHEI
jgi:hypothetical protein